MACDLNFWDACMPNTKNSKSTCRLKVYLGLGVQLSRMVLVVLMYTEASSLATHIDQYHVFHSLL